MKQKWQTLGCEPISLERNWSRLWHAWSSTSLNNDMQKCTSSVSHWWLHSQTTVVFTLGQFASAPLHHLHRPDPCMGLGPVIPQWTEGKIMVDLWDVWSCRVIIPTVVTSVCSLESDYQPFLFHGYGQGKKEPRSRWLIIFGICLVSYYPARYPNQLTHHHSPCFLLNPLRSPVLPSRIDSEHLSRLFMIFSVLSLLSRKEKHIRYMTLVIQGWWWNPKKLWHSFACENSSFLRVK